MRTRFTTVVVVKNPALPNREGMMSEVELDLLLDAVRMAMAAAPQQGVLIRPLSFNQPPRATNDHQMAWPFIPFPEGWYACC